MANTLTAVTPKLLAQGLMALRQFAITPRLVNRRYEELAGERGSTIDVPIPSAIVAQAVSPAATPPSTADVSPTTVPVVLDQWFEAPFYLTDRDMLEAMNGTIPMQASEAIKALANNVDSYILGLYKKFYGAVGTAGTTPLASSTADATGVRAVLNRQLAPLDDRYVVMNPDMEANALNLRAFQDASYSGNVQAILEGQLNRKLGFTWFMDQNIPTHTAGTAASYLINGTMTLGTKTLTVDGGSGTLVVGDLITIAGDPQTYVVTAAMANAGTSISIEPGLQRVPADNAAITRVASHVVNLAFHRDAIAFATRPLAQDGQGLGAIIMSEVDPVTNLALRLEITREHKRTRFSYDILYGAEVVRRELGARILG